jgi:hypothetical protein
MLTHSWCNAVPPHKFAVLEVMFQGCYALLSALSIRMHLLSCQYGSWCPGIYSAVARKHQVLKESTIHLALLGNTAQTSAHSSPLHYLELSDQPCSRPSVTILQLSPPGVGGARWSSHETAPSALLPACGVGGSWAVGEAHEQAQINTPIPRGYQVVHLFLPLAVGSTLVCVRT